MKKALFFYATLCTLNALSQTGPGGVGTSTNNVLWLDANRGVSISGTAVTSWADQSGNTNNANPNAATNRPAYVTSSVNGYPSLDFDGTDDELRVTDNATIDLTQWHFFVVVIADLLKDYNAWMVKGNDGQENFEMLSYSTGNIHTPTYYTDATRTFPSSTASQVNTSTFEIIEYSYSTSVGRDVYKNNGTAIITDNESKTPQTNAFDLYIGNERSTTGRFLNGDVAEVIAYNAPLNSAQRIIVNNYLAAKYNRTLTNNDIYDEDNAGAGNYDHNVAGIGRIDASNQQTHSYGNGIVRVLNATGLDDNEFFIWGHDNGTLGTWGSTDLPTGIQGRWFRTWRVSEVNSSGTAVDVGSVDIRFDLTGLGSVTVTDLRLLVDTDNDGLFADETPISGAISYGSNVYGFAGVSAIGNNMRFTLATINQTQTMLPIELLGFDAVLNGDKVDITWATASEINNDYFTIERSKDGELWAEIATVDGAGNSNNILNYMDIDASPLNGTSYYRLKQTDFDGKFSYSQIEVVHNNSNSSTTINPFPNPSDGNSFNLEFTGFSDEEVLLVIRDIQGKQFYSKMYLVNDHSNIVAVSLEQQLPVGTYLITASSDESLVSKKIVVK